MENNHILYDENPNLTEEQVACLMERKKPFPNQKIIRVSTVSRRDDRLYEAFMKASQETQKSD